jgi:hypothetical protein
MNFQIEKEFIQQILNYLAGRPFGEVYQLIAKIQQLQPVPTPQPEPLKVVAETK